MLWLFLENNSFTKAMMTHCLCNVTWSGDINQSKLSILWELTFWQDLKQKLAPQRPPNVPKAFFVGKVKKIKGPWDKIAHQGWHT